ncbi:uncharacterized protein [Nicotiana tomentosiformis]|uniref:uncharacterized protein n=1 Tax=Nicotiana tomentosiformis TaxID=4098 RepID=UPI00388CC742
MAKTSKTIPQKEKAPSSQPPADKIPVEPRPEEYVLGACVLTSNFKVDKDSSVPGRCEPVSKYMCSITEGHLEQLKKDCNWENKKTVIPSLEEDITTYVKGLLSVGKVAVLRPPPGEEEASISVPKSVKDNKRKRASSSKDPKSKMRTARKPKKNIISLTMESVLHLRDEDKEEEENDGSVLVARMKKTIDAPKAAESMVIYKAPPRTEEISDEGSGRVPELLEIEDASHRSQQTVGISEALRTEENAPSESLGAIATTVHREACSRSRAELRRYEADLRRVIEERNTLRLLFRQRKEEIKDLRAELAKAQQEQIDLTEQVMIILKIHGLDSGMMANILISHLQQKLEVFV